MQINAFLAALNMSDGALMFFQREMRGQARLKVEDLLAQNSVTWLKAICNKERIIKKKTIFVVV